MNYQPVTAVWEITMGCNMRCGHCGSSCKEALSDELTTDEALKVCQSMSNLKMKWVTLSGGEPLTRKDWYILAENLSKKGIIPNIISNGWLINDDIIQKAKKSNIGTFAISIDGLEDTHDKIRKKGSYKRVINAFNLLHKYNQTSGAITTVINENINQLHELKEVLIKNNVNSWQLQIGLPMGNLSSSDNSIISPEKIDYLIDFIYQTAMEGKIVVFPADCLGYFTEKEAIIRQVSSNHFEPIMWQGCNAGKRSFGLLHNGDVLGCTSIRDKKFIEGNVKNTDLENIWSKNNSFSWARNLKKKELDGNCKECEYGDVCLGGCPNTRLTTNGSIYSDNIYCSFNNAIENTKKTLHKYNNIEELYSIAKNYAENNKWQLAFLTINRALEIEPQNTKCLELSGYINFFMGNFERSKEDNTKIINEDSNNAYALKGLGLSLHKLGNSNEGIEYLLKAIENASSDYTDPFYDLSITYNELGKKRKAINILEEGENKFPGFLNKVQPLYNMLKYSE
jgi:radical SAM protein with 4Fe4S-binding SPASM domain